jgi:hypothetical protein
LLLIPQTFGPYELDEVLGRGHTGEVYRAWDTRRSRTVALEVLSPELSADPRFRARFEQVSRAVAAIEEPHVVVVHEVGEVDGRLYRDVQLVDGRALSAVLATEGPLSAVVAVDVVGQVAAALDAAHAAGVVHGSVRASDVLVSGHPDRPECHLTHFGLADRPDGRPADPRADVSALAWLLSELLTGRPRGGDTGGTAPGGGGRHREPPYPTGEDSVPPALEAVVARSTAADPAGRYASAGALAAAARAALRRTSDTVPVQAVSAPASAGAASGAAGGAAAARTAGAGAAAARQARRRASPLAPRSQRRRELAAVLVAAAVGLTAAGGVVAVRLAADDSDAVASTPVVLEPADDPGDAPFVPAPPGTTGAAGETGDRAPGSAGTPQGSDDPAPGSAGTPQDGERPAEEGAATTPGGDDTAPGGDDTAPGGDDTAPGGDDTAPGGDTAPGTAGTAPGSGDADSGDADSGAGAPDGAAGSPVAGDRPGLYGGSGAEVCDAAGMVAYLAEHPDRAAAFADVEGIPADGIDEHLAALTPVVLRFDTAVTNHGFADGRARPFQSVLQAGTAVLVDESGVPQVRCICGNPLEPPAERPDPDLRGDPWPGSSPDQVVVVERSAARVAEFVLVDDASGVVEARPARTAGEADRVVDAVLAEQALAFGSDLPASTTGSGTTSADPPPADPSGAGSTPPVPSPSGGGDTSRRPGGTEDGAPAEEPPAEGPRSGETPAEEPPAPVEDTPAEDTPAEDRPAEDAPADEAPAPAEEVPAEEPATEEVPAEEPPAEEAPTTEPPATEPPATEDVPAEESPTETEEPPTEEPPTEEAPTEEPPTEEAPAS